MLIEAQTSLSVGDQPSLGSPNQPLVEEHRLVLGQVTRGPANAVFAVQLGRERSTSEVAVEALLEAPRGELTIAIEAHLQVSVPQHVMHRAESVVRRRPLHIPSPGEGGRARGPRWSPPALGLAGPK